MNTKRCKIWGIILLFLLIIAAFAAFINDRRNRPSFDFTELIEHDLENINLTIYFLRYPTLIYIALDDLTIRWYDYKVIVTGEELAEYRDLLIQLANIELISAGNESRIIFIQGKDRRYVSVKLLEGGRML